MEIIGHRGASFDAPENTLASVNLAWEQNADAVEIDVFFTRDGEIVSIHDGTTKRYGGPDLAIAAQSRPELRRFDLGAWKSPKWAGERIATLSDVLATIPDGKRLFIEIKCGDEIVPELVRAIEASGKTPKQTAVIGFGRSTLAAVKRKMPERPAYWVAELKKTADGAWRPPADELVRLARESQLDGLDMGNCAGIDKAFVTKANEAGLGVYIWTVNSLEEAHRLGEVGVDGIATDRPGWLRERLAETGRS